ncbi:hypothetical protein TorRG33x02_233910 [Trema orientale]|uniref:Uncharacterized protein n=1 Tax=Trema orientale TaxID=63057 RepID=A0A2P5E4A8_TREOI|nr:hypothetical protein TorRG33x02_233910 [Trema orientale]
MNIEELRTKLHQFMNSIETNSLQIKGKQSNQIVSSLIKKNHYNSSNSSKQQCLQSDPIKKVEATKTTPPIALANPFMVRLRALEASNAATGLSNADEEEDGFTGDGEGAKRSFGLGAKMPRGSNTLSTL